MESTLVKPNRKQLPTIHIRMQEERLASIFRCNASLFYNRNLLKCFILNEKSAKSKSIPLVRKAIISINQIDYSTSYDNSTSLF